MLHLTLLFLISTAVTCIVEIFMYAPNTYKIFESTFSYEKNVIKINSKKKTKLLL